MYLSVFNVLQVITVMKKVLQTLKLVLQDTTVPITLPTTQPTLAQSGTNVLQEATLRLSVLQASTKTKLNNPPANLALQVATVRNVQQH
jgi:hypothetical protein